MPLKDFVQYELKSGSPTPVGAATMTPQSQVLTVRWPNGGWVWNRPVAMLVEQNGEIERLPIVDVTRFVQLGLIAFAFFFAMLTLLAKLGRKRGN